MATSTGPRGDTRPATTTTSSSSKTIYLVRHAQSEQNVTTHRLQHGDILAVGSLMSLGYDAPVSKEGQMQLDAARERLATFVRDKGIALVAHSPLQRAVATANAIFQGRGPPLVERQEMYERTVSEYFAPSLLDQRIEQLREWIVSREETVIALVGHGQYFKRCLGAPRVMENIEVIECSFNSVSGFGLFSSVFGGFEDPNHATTHVLGTSPALSK